MAICKGTKKAILGIVFGSACVAVVIIGFFKLGEFEKHGGDKHPKKTYPECGSFGHFGWPNDCRCNGEDDHICTGDQYCSYPNPNQEPPALSPACVDWNFLAMPKIELHSQFDGSFDSEILFNAAKAKNSTLPEELRGEIEACQSLDDFINLTSMPKNPESASLDNMQKVFGRILPIVKDDISLLVKLAEAYVENRRKHNVLYTEVRYSPLSLASDDMGRRELVWRLGETFDKAATLKNPIRIKQIISTLDTEQAYAAELVAIANDFSQQMMEGAYVVGVDITGGETHFIQGEHHKAYVDAMDQASHDKLGIAVDAGQIGVGKNVLKAKADYGATRVGHGYHYFMENKAADIPDVHFEACISSAWQTGAIPISTKPHPILEMRRRKARMGLNTDHASVFRTNITNEYKIAMGLGFTLTDFHEMAKDQLNAVFDESVKTNSTDPGTIAWKIEEFYSKLHPATAPKKKEVIHG